MKSIADYIYDIQQKPYHIRVRYVVGAVSFCMVLVLTTWFIELHETFSSVRDTPGFAESASKEEVTSQSIVEEIREQGDQLGEELRKGLNLLNSGGVQDNNQNNTNNVENQENSDRNTQPTSPNLTNKNAPTKNDPEKRTIEKGF